MVTAVGDDGQVGHRNRSVTVQVSIVSQGLRIINGIPPSGIRPACCSGVGKIPTDVIDHDLTVIEGNRPVAVNVTAEEVDGIPGGEGQRTGGIQSIIIEGQAIPAVGDMAGLGDFQEIGAHEGRGFQVKGNLVEAHAVAQRHLHGEERFLGIVGPIATSVIADELIEGNSGSLLRRIGPNCTLKGVILRDLQVSIATLLALPGGYVHSHAGDIKLLGCIGSAVLRAVVVQNSPQSPRQNLLLSGKLIVRLYAEQELRAGIPGIIDAQFIGQPRSRIRIGVRHVHHSADVYVCSLSALPHIAQVELKCMLGNSIVLHAVQPSLVVSEDRYGNDGIFSPVLRLDPTVPAHRVGIGFGVGGVIGTQPRICRGDNELRLLAFSPGVYTCRPVRIKGRDIQGQPPVQQPG